jgi:phage baseplate assembly protein gpV
MQKEPSKFRPVSFGIAAENLKMGSDILEVVAVEWMPYLDGEINAEPQVLEDSGVDGLGQEYTAKVETANSLPAKWLPMDDNRATPPNIRRGERVQIYQFADSQQFYWSCFGLDKRLRRLETVVYMFSNTRDEKTTVLDSKNSYTLEVSTHTKQITLRTNKNDGEPFAYTFQFNTKVGCVTLADDDNNFIEFDSAERKITAQNKDGSFITIDKRVIRQFAPDLIHMQTQAFELHCDTALVNAAQSITANTTDTTLNSSASIAMTTADTTITSSASITATSATFTGNIPTSTFTGMVTVSGLLTMAGGFAAIPGGGGGGSLSVPVTITAPMTSTAEITVNGIGLSTHKHVEAGDGAPVTPPIP